jgi:hypothetical protein
MNRFLARWWPPLGFFALTLLLFAPVLFTSQRLVLSTLIGDLASQFVYWRSFGFGELRQGNLALWNPYVYSGTPYFSAFQSALLYPPNWLHLCLPLEKACNWNFALHVFLMGWFTHLWVSRHRLHPLACFVAGVLTMLGGAFFLHIFAGHLTNVDALTWMPLLLLAVDGLLENTSAAGRVRRDETMWVLLGALAVAMQLLAGHPQTVFRSGVAVMLYAVLRVCALHGATRNERLRSAVGVLLLYVGALALTAVQILPGLEMAGESSRQAGITLKVAAMLSLPPENLLTLFLPDFFGNGTSVSYWGRWYGWETIPFVGIVGLLLATMGMWQALRERKWVYLAIPLVLIVLALGAYTPLFPLLFHFVPGFNKFRVNAEFIAPASLFLAYLAALGLNALLKNPPRSWAWPAATAVLGGVFLIAGWQIQRAATSLSRQWVGVMQAMEHSKETYLSASVYHDPAFLMHAGQMASAQVLVAAGLCLAMALLVAVSRRWPRAICGVALLAVLEMAWFARGHLPTFELSALRQPTVEAFFTANPPSVAERVLNIEHPNSGLRFGAYDIWAYDPIVLGRYAQFMAWTQSQNPDTAEMYVDFKHLHPLYRILRLRYVFLTENGEVRVGQAAQPPLPQVLLAPEYAVEQSRAAVFAAMNRKDFDPRREVILESEPQPRPAKGARGFAKVTRQGTDFLEIEAQTDKPTMLLVTDSYSNGWKAWGMEGSAQQEYSVLPANYVLRAIPLEAGHHRICMEYVPRGFTVGKWISLVALVLYLGAWVGISTASKKRRQEPSASAVPAAS